MFFFHIFILRLCKKWASAWILMALVRIGTSARFRKQFIFLQVCRNHGHRDSRQYEPHPFQGEPQQRTSKPAAHQQHASKWQQQRTSNAPASAPATHQRHISKCRCTSDTAHARAVPEFGNFCKRRARCLWCRWCFSAAAVAF